MGETRVDLLHLLEDLRDAYPAAIEETILTEVVANALDSGAGHVRFLAEPAGAGLTVLDDGSGMRRRELARYHDLASSGKVRGHGIGFAGVGIKLGLLVCDEVITETRRGKVHVASAWHLASRHRAPWKWIAPPGMLVERGTAVRLRLKNPLSPLLDPGFIEATLRHHYRPLLERGFDLFVHAQYPRGVRFEVNGRTLLPEDPHRTGETAMIQVRLARKRKPSAIGYLRREDAPLPEHRRGIAVSTFGKVIKIGWEWLGITPAAPDRIEGLIEAPDLAACLTLDKANFIRSGPRGGVYLAYRKAIQEAVSRRLEAWGDVQEEGEVRRRRVTRPVERDLERVLIDLADDFPLLASLVERRAGGQRRLPLGRPGEGRGAGAFAPARVTGETTGLEGGAPSERAEAPEPPAIEVSPETQAPQEGEAQPEPLALPGAGGPRKPARYGLHIEFQSRPEDPEMARLVESTVLVNDAHPAYRRAAASRSEGYHTALAVALALGPLAVEPKEEHGFVTAFMARWGEALDQAGKGRGKGRRKADR